MIVGCFTRLFLEGDECGLSAGCRHFRWASPMVICIGALRAHAEGTISDYRYTENKKEDDF
jgi:hypothetical protein